MKDCNATASSIFKNAMQKHFIYVGLIFLTLFPILIAYIYCLLFSVNIPFWDNYQADIFVAIKLYLGNATLHDFIHTHNDFYPIMSYLIITPLYGILSFNMISIVFFSFILYLITFIILFFIFLRNCFNMKFALCLFVPVSFFYFNLYLFTNYIWGGLFLQSSLVLLFALLMFFCLNKSVQVDRWFFMGLIGAICCMFTFSAGVPIWIGGFVQLILQKGSNYLEKLLAWIISAGVFYYIYYIYLGFPSNIPSYNVHTTSAYANYFLNTITHPIEKLLCLFGTIGSNVIHDSSYAMFFGLLITVIAFIVVYINREDLDLPKTSILFGMLIYSLVVSILLTISRSGGEGTVFGPSTIYFIPGTRHFPNTILLIISLYLLVMHYYMKSRTEFLNTNKPGSLTNISPHSLSLHTCLAGIMIILLLLGSVFHFTPGLDSGKSWFLDLNHKASLLLNYDTVPMTDLEILGPNTTLVISTGDFFKNNHFSVFDKKESLYDQSPWINELRTFIFNNKGILTPYSEINQSQDYFKKPGKILYNFDAVFTNPSNISVLTLIGWAFSPEIIDSNFSTYIFFTGDDGTIKIFKTKENTRPDVTKAYDNLSVDLNKSGFEVNILKSEFVEQTYSIGFVIMNQTEIVYSSTEYQISGSIFSKMNTNILNPVFLSYQIKNNQSQDYFKKPGKILYNLDAVSTNPSNVSVLPLTGWAFSPEIIDSNFSTYIFFKGDDGTIKIFNPKQITRPDVTKAYNNLNIDLNASGFEANLLKSEFVEQPYGLGFVIMNQTKIVYSLTDYRIPKSIPTNKVTTKFDSISISPYMMGNNLSSRDKSITRFF